MHRTNKIATFATAALWTASALFAADYQTGLDAFRDGDMSQALAEWRPLAEAGDPDAQYALGKMYEYGQGLTRNDRLAAIWYERAAQQNKSDAQYRLGVFYDNGWGVPRDPVLAVTWYRRAAHLGHVFAQHDLAFMHLNGTGVPPDAIEAYKWLRIASTQRADLMAKHLSFVAQSMNAADIQKAEMLARAWLQSQDI